jgi:signal transduction histidine kinase
LENNLCIKPVRRFLTIASFCFAVSSSIAQGRIDSLEKELTKNNPDSVRVNILINLSFDYQYLNYEKSMEFANEAVRIADENNFVRLQPRAYQQLGTLYTLSGDYTTALKYDNIALRHSLNINDSIRISDNYNGIANDYYDLGEYDDAYYYFTQAYRIGDEINDPLRKTIAIHNLGRVFKELGQYSTALEHLNRSQKLSKSINDLEGVPYSLHEIGDVQLRKGEYDSALRTLQRALALTRQQNIDILEPRTLAKIATAYMYKKDFQRAMAYYDSTHLLHLKTNNQFGMAEVELGRGTVLARQKKYDEAVRYINSSLEKAKKSNARILQIKCYNQLSEIYEMKGDHNKSLAYFKQFRQLEDSLFSHDMQEKLLRDQIRFETEAKDTQIAALSRAQNVKDDQLKKQEFVRNILVVVMALSVILLATVYRSGQRRRQINALLLKHQEETEKRSEELEKLNQVKDKFFSIISHDLRSPINALSGLLDLLDKGAVKPDELPAHLSELKSRFNHTRTLLNNLLDWTLLQMDKLNLQASRIDLNKIVEENIQLLGAVQTKKIALINKVPLHAYAYADSNTTNLVIRNLMTNAIKFTNDGGQVVIAADEQPTHWLISVKDNGVGITEDVLKILFDKTAPYTTRGTANEKGTGLGLILCKEFVEKNGGKISVTSQEGSGSIFRFTLPKPA